MNAPSLNIGKGPIIHRDLIQGSEEWLQQRCGMLTASEMKLIITPTLKITSNEKERAHLYELLAQRISGYVEPRYISDDMLRGRDDEIEARIVYDKTYAPVEEIGFITNDRWGFTIGYSPDGKVIGENAGIEAKSRRQKFQIETIASLAMPVDFALQVQTGLVVAEWDWIDFISYSGGLPMVTLRVWPDPVTGDAIINAAGEFERRLSLQLAAYQDALTSDARLIPTERRIEEEMYV